PQAEDEAGISRRDLLAAGAAGLGAATLLPPDGVHAQPGDAAEIRWDHKFDVVVVGAGCAGLTAAIRARDLGASVLVVEASHDVGGRMLNSGSSCRSAVATPCSVGTCAASAMRKGASRWIRSRSRPSSTTTS